MIPVKFHSCPFQGTFQHKFQNLLEFHQNDQIPAGIGGGGGTDKTSAKPCNILQTLQSKPMLLLFC